jgi:hypothetical protein
MLKNWLTIERVLWTAVGMAFAIPFLCFVVVVYVLAQP